MRLKPREDIARNPLRRKRAIRLLIRCVFFAAMVLLLTGLVRPWSWAPLLVPALSPYVLIASALAGRTVTAGWFSDLGSWWRVALPPAVWVGLPVLMLVLFSRRWFCRYACPVGLCTAPLQRLRPSAKTAFASLPYLGRWIAVATLAGAALGYPLALWFDPMAIFSGAFTLWHDPAAIAGWAALGGLVLIAASAALWPHAWCLRVCPLGATQELLFRGVRSVPATGRVVRKAGRASDRGPIRVSRRAVFSFGTGALAAAAGAGVARWARAAASRSTAAPIRPPGAASEGQFPWLCLRCGNCLRVCPEGILHPDQSPETIVGYLSPIVRFDQSYCKEDCRRCTEVCPSGAIAPLMLEAKPSHPIGLAKLDMSLCLLSPENGERECAICRNACPYGAIELVFDYETYITTPRVDPQKCPGCGACEAVCPGINERGGERLESMERIDSRKAIWVAPHREKRGEI
ncbi:MAG: 4Fe-4S dicluster domain-containing protein [Rhodopirellula sp.]|nr:4Fe-4S dicluster domain-containing protein [Rhodopirellula sp.]